MAEPGKRSMKGWTMKAVLKIKSLPGWWQLYL